MVVDHLSPCKGIMLDIEGTICPISFVKDVLFPYALESLPGVLEAQWDSTPFVSYREAFPLEHRASPAALLAHVQDLMARDVKISYLKSLQGYLWRSGYQSGALKCPLFADVAPAMQKWHDAGKRIVIYSSGSVAAQHLLLQHTTESGNNGDLRHFISGWYDTVNAGMKNQQTSYERIVTEENDQAANIKPEEWVFFSDNIKELEPARLAGLQVVLADRPGNAEVDDIEKVKYVVAERFDTLDI